MLTPVRHVMDVVGYVDPKDIIHSINVLRDVIRRFPILDTGQGLGITPKRTTRSATLKEICTFFLCRKRFRR
jgi:hypothetical protein